MSSAIGYQHIVTTPGIMGGKPRIANRRISVQNIIIWHEQMGFSVDEIATGYDLSLSEIYAALAYYYDHKATIDQAIKDDEALVEQLRKQTPSLLAQKLYERKD
mgnify:CR=1 FL=1